jgi:hypothetical protein
MPRHATPRATIDARATSFRLLFGAIVDDEGAFTTAIAPVPVLAFAAAFGRWVWGDFHGCSRDFDARADGECWEVLGRYWG